MNREGRVAGRVAIVTGGAQGIGARYAKILAAEGAAVMVADILDTGAVVEAIGGAGGKAAGMTVDVRNAAAVRELVAETVRAFGGLDILVNNAALFAPLPPKRFELIESDEWDEVMATNVRGVFECTKAAVPEMRKKKYGKIVNISSGTVFKGAAMLLHYVSSKGAVVAMTRCLARELGDDGIRVNSIAPGLTMSEGVLANPAKLGPSAQANLASRAIKRHGEPEDMCGTLLYLCSPESDFVTGQTIVVDGGSVMH